MTKYSESDSFQINKNIGEDDQTIAAIATAYGTAAISIIRISGKESHKIRDKIFKSKIKSSKKNDRKLICGTIIDKKNKEIDKVLLASFTAPNSYTGENLFEIHCHGGIYITEKVYQTILQAGAKPARPGEFTARAFYNNKMDLTQAEAVMDIINAKTKLAHISATSQLSGNISKEIDNLKSLLIKTLSHIEAYIDFPEEDIEPNTKKELITDLEKIKKTISQLITTEKFGNIIRNGALCILTGVPNVGKSSLLNKILGYERAIVSSTKGTTRDSIEEMINLDGIPLRITDTAGIRTTSKKIEKKGIQRTKNLIKNADIILEIYDISENPSNQKIDYLNDLDDKEETDSSRKKVIKILNKIDKKPHPDWKKIISKNSQNYQTISCLESHESFRSDNIKDEETSNTQIKKILEIIKNKIFELNKENNDPTNPISINKRHQKHLKQALSFLKQAIDNLHANAEIEIISIDIRTTLHELESIIGTVDTEEILGEIFSKFCIGK